MLQLNTKKNIPLNVPENIDEDETLRFKVSEVHKALEYYNEHGYVIFSKCINQNDCDHILSLWNKLIKTYKGKIYRQTTGKAEKNIFNDSNWVMNPVLNLQSLNPKKFGELRQATEHKIFNNKNLCGILNNFFSDKPKIIQSMFFEGNSFTQEHQDTYYLDSENVGNLTAAWIALEEIKANAGRFFVCSKSHKINIKELKYYNQILSNHDLYVDEIISICRENGFEFKAPFLDKGDVLLWNSKTLHGSLNSNSTTNSRASITLHSIPSKERHLQWHSRFIDMKLDDLGNSLIYRRKDQNLFFNKFILFIESYFPLLFYYFKKIIVKLVFKQSHY